MALKYEEYFPSEADGLRISVMALLPNEKPYRGIVQLVHGMSEPKERYLPFMEYLTEQGYATIIHDHRGHGKSVRSRADLGYMYGGGAEAIVQDIATVNQGVRAQFPDLPLILFGHSMGSLAVRAFARTHDDSIDMLIVCGTPFNNPGRGFAVGVAKIEQKLLGPRHKSTLLESLVFGNFYARFRNEGRKSAWICSDEDVSKEYRKSELCGFTFTDDGYLALFELMKLAYDVKHWNCTKPKMPVLFVSGADDPCMGNVRKFAASVQAMRSVGYLDVKGKLYPGMRHEILNEKDKDKVYRDILVYMKKKGF